MRDARNGRLKALSIGSHQHQNLQFSEGRSNTLGLDYLRRYRVTLDLAGENIYLAQGKRFAEPDRGPTIGWRLLFKSGRVTIDEVDEKGPAFAAGVRAGDALLEVFGKSVSSLSASKIASSLIPAEGRPVAVTVERHGKRLAVNLMPKPYVAECRAAR